MKKKYKSKCPTCNEPIEQKGERSMTACPSCGIKWGFRVADVNGKEYIELFQQGRPRQDEDIKKRKYSVSLSRAERRNIEEAGWNPNSLLQWAYYYIIKNIDIR